MTPTQVDVPPPIAKLVSDWRSGGRASQSGIDWPRERWLASFPECAELLRRLPDRLDRSSVRAACGQAREGPSRVQEAFIAAMAWGYGSVGYGPWRARRVLDTTPDPATRLAAVVGELATHGPLEAYRRLANNCRLRWLGPAFGTKFLYFCPQAEGARALILDRLVAAWLGRYTDERFNPVPWSTATYARYLDVLQGWASLLGVQTDVIEERVFIAEASRTGGQWSANP